MKVLLAKLLGLALLACLGLACGPRESAGPEASAPTSKMQTPQIGAPADSPAKRKALYYPNAKIYGERPTQAIEIDVLTSDGLTLKAWHRRPPTDGWLILYFHGNGGNLTALGEQLRVFERLDLGYLAVDYRGFGQSEGDPSEAGLYLDAEAAYRRAIEMGYSPAHIVIFGRSLGGGVATHLAAKEPAAGLILESTFTSVEEVAKRTHGSVAATLVNGFRSIERMPKIEIPTFIMHGDKDSIIPPDMASALAKASPKAEVWMIEGADHNTVRKAAGAEYPERIAAFLGTLRTWTVLERTDSE